MARPGLTNDDIIAFRERALVVVDQIIRDVGLAGLTMRGLSSKLGMKQASLYRYFASKDDLVWEYSMRTVARLDRALRVFWPTQGNIVAAIQGLMRAYAGFAMEDTARFRAVFMETDPEGNRRALANGEMMAPFVLLEEMVEAAVCAGQLSAPAGSPALARALWAAIHGAVVLHLTIDDGRDLSASFIEDVIGSILAQR